MSLQAISKVTPDISNRAWRLFDEHLTCLYWQPLWDYITQIASTLPPEAGFIKKTGEIHRSRLAQRLGIDNSCLSKPQWGGPKMQLRNFLVTLAVCNIEWQEVGFPPPILAVLESLRSVFPLVATTPTCSDASSIPTIEELLVLYFCYNLSEVPPVLEVSRSDVVAVLNEDNVVKIVDSVKSMEWSRQVDSDCELVPLVCRQMITDFRGIIATLRRFGDGWTMMRRVFPFLVSQTPDSSMQNWQTGWGFL